VKKYPYTAWRLMPSFKPAEVVITNSARHYWHGTVEVDGKGKQYKPGEIHASREAVIEYGNSKLDAQMIALAKQVATINKHRVALEKDAK
jgi:hypothetical protein